MRWFLAVGGVGAVVFAFHRAATYAASRGWIFYRNGPRRSNAVGGLFEEIFEPEITYMVEELQSEAIRADEDETGESVKPVNRPTHDTSENNKIWSCSYLLSIPLEGGP